MSVTAGQRVKGALLAGLCAAAARRLGWNVWAIRLLAVVGLLLQPLVVGGGYLALAVGFGWWRNREGAATEAGPEQPEDSPDDTGGLAAANLEARGRRIADLERRFRALERE
ncbi:PspC domain-containing protein [Marinihelvus fidelis]|uniref:PspC domain-containing protein n=1 Tax=Marinihelvus fidelis TaxID=2613842 RepID=A0A5N0T866_9GAMM|nr:PspC domain-containing protein [Marinihelvus fidelis]KAA9130941.1 PspC domain-containing protein [Marinihelvus fidelis]